MSLWLQQFVQYTSLSISSLIFLKQAADAIEAFSQQEYVQKTTAI